MTMSPNKTEGDCSNALFGNLRQLITVVDDLRDVGLHQYISLPSVVVVGTQSAGKSSVLESIVGHDFLPRGEGVCTRRPLELRLVHLSASDQRSGEQQPWACFDGSEEKIFDFDRVRTEIQGMTDKVAGHNKGIVDDPIKLTIYGRETPDLTLIDLPGITRVPAAGSDQQDDIEAVTKSMTMRYVKDPRAVILAVMPANVDMTTSDALQLARQVDPEGIRTIGVLTKIDIMDKGTNARKALMGQEIALRLGFVGIKNRSQADIAEKKSVQAAVQEEAVFFREHPVYSGLPTHMYGTKALVDKVTTVLFGHIKHFLPAISKELDNKVREVGEEYKALGEPVPIGPEEVTHSLWNMITAFCEMFRASIRGSYDRRLHSSVIQNIDPSALSGGAKVRYILNQLLKEYNDGDNATAEYSDGDIETAIRIHEGDTLPGFPSVDVFEYLIRPLLEKLREPIMDTLNEVYLSLDNLSNQLLNKVFRRFPELHSECIGIVSNILNNELERTREVVESLIQAEEGYIFTNDRDYIEQRTTRLRTRDELESNQEVNPDTYFVNEMRHRLNHYFKVVVHNIRDTVPKAIGYFLVKAAQEKMQYECHTAIQSNPRLVDLITEPKHIAEERMSLSKQLETMRKAQRVLKRDPQLAGLQAELRDEQLSREAALTFNPQPDAVISASGEAPAEPEPKPVVKEKKVPEVEKPVERERQPYGQAAKPAAAASSVSAKKANVQDKPAEAKPKAKPKSDKGALALFGSDDD